MIALLLIAAVALLVVGLVVYRYQRNAAAIEARSNAKMRAAIAIEDARPLAAVFGPEDLDLDTPQGVAGWLRSQGWEGEMYQVDGDEDVQFVETADGWDDGRVVEHDTAATEPIGLEIAIRPSRRYSLDWETSTVPGNLLLVVHLNAAARACWDMVCSDVGHEVAAESHDPELAAAACGYLRQLENLVRDLPLD